jgi:hypothetical protein
VQSVSRTFSLPRRGRQVIEADLNCSELRRPAYAWARVAWGCVRRCDRCKQPRCERLVAPTLYYEGCRCPGPKVMLEVDPLSYSFQTEMCWLVLRADAVS